MDNQYFLDKFEEELCKYTGAPYCVLVDSCTNAIFLCLERLKETSYVPYEHYITIPKNTYIGVPHSIVNAGYVLEFSDEKWRGSYELSNTPIMDSAVDFHKGMYQKGYMQCLSFQQKKRLNIGKGGAILLDNADDYEALKSLAFDGRSQVKTIEHWTKGFHMNMTPDQAAQGLLILNQINLRPDNQGSYLDYPDLTKVKYFKE